MPPSSRRGRRRGRARPDLSDVAETQLPRGVVGEIRRHSTDPDEVLAAVGAGAEALLTDDLDRAVDYLAWAKEQAPRAPSIRETLAIAYYRAERFDLASSELNTYRRLTGRTDQNHLLADCLRALDRPTAAVAELVQEMDAERDGVDRVVEGAIVWASALADAGDPGAGRNVLERVLPSATEAADRDESDPGWHLVRLWYVAGDLADRDGDPETAIRWFRRVAAEEPDLFDVAERLERLEG